MQQVTLGDKQWEIRGFSGFKAIEASAMVAALFDEVPELYKRAAEFSDSYVAQSRVSIDRAAAEFRYGDEARQVSDRAWETSSNRLTLENPPDGNDVLMAVFPYAFGRARSRLVDLLALVLTPNSVFEDNDDGSGNVDVDAAIKDAKAALLHKGTGDQIIAVAGAAWKVLQEQFEPHKEEVGNLMGQLRALTAQRQSEESQDPEPTQEASGEPGTEASHKPSDEPASSPGSPAPSDGPEAKSSTESRGSSSSPLARA